MNESCPQSAPQADPAPAAAALTCDGFLGGRIRLWQPRRGYRAGVDPVLLAAAVTARPGEAVLDLGCGAGAAVLCLAARVSGLRLAGVEIQPFYADLARRNAEANGIALEVLEADLAAPRGLAAGAFDHAIANPPYYRAENGPAPADAGRAAAFAETQGLAVWTAAARRALRQGGVLTVIQHTERLPELLGALDRFGSVAVLPIAGRTSRPAERVLVRAVKGGRGAFRLLTPLVLHHGFRHGAEDDGYAPSIEAVLRNGEALRPGFAHA